ncbi:MAG: transporter substrate-binding domain-containing protein [Bacteroidota bacterium]
MTILLVMSQKLALKYYFIALLLLGIFGLISCGNGKPEEQVAVEEPSIEPIDFDLDGIRQRGAVVAILDNSSTGYFIYKGQPMGYEFDLLTLFAKHLNIRLKIELTNSIDQAFDMLNQGRGDIIAYNLTITNERKKRAQFSESHYKTKQVLVQRKPDGWRKLTRDKINNSLIRDQNDLMGKKVYVRKSSSYVQRLKNLADEIGDQINIVEMEDSVETERLIKMVAEGEIDYTISDESVARVNAAYYPNIDVYTPISFPQRIAWAVRHTSDSLLNELNSWLARIKKQPTYNVVYNKYFNSPRSSLIRANSDFSSISGQKISPYDFLIKPAADSIGWDWRLLASQIYQESKFDPNAKSWAGAIGLMQLVPETGKRFGARVLTDPAQSIEAGTAYIKHLEQLWAKTIPDEFERKKFVLASYNVGLGHVVDARDLAKKYGKEPDTWEDHVEYYLLNKSKKKYINDPVVNFGYCRGEEPVKYVREILNRYAQYSQLIASN